MNIKVQYVQEYTFCLLCSFKKKKNLPNSSLQFYSASTFQKKKKKTVNKVYNDQMTLYTPEEIKDSFHYHISQITFSHKSVYIH